MLTATLAVFIWTGITRALIGAGMYIKRGWGYPLAALLALLVGPLHGAEYFYMDQFSTLWTAPTITLWMAMMVLPVLYFVVPWLTLTANIINWNHHNTTALQWGVGPLVLAVWTIFFRMPDLHNGLVVVAWVAASTTVGYFYSDMLNWLQAKLGTPKQIAGVALDANRVTEFMLGLAVMGPVCFIN